MEGDAGLGPSPRRNASGGTRPAAKQRETTTAVRSEGQRGRPVDRESARQRRQHGSAEGLPGGSPDDDEEPGECRVRLPTERGRTGTIQPGNAGGLGLREQTHAVHDGGT